jgi:hypothetical protein
MAVVVGGVVVVNVVGDHVPDSVDVDVTRPA